jgi:hypothetical protein
MKMGELKEKITEVPFTAHFVTYVKAMLEFSVGFFFQCEFFTNGKCRNEIKDFLATYGTRIASGIDGNQCSQLEGIEREIGEMVEAAEKALQDANPEDPAEDEKDLVELSE